MSSEKEKEEDLLETGRKPSDSSLTVPDLEDKSLGWSQSSNVLPKKLTKKLIEEHRVKSSVAELSDTHLASETKMKTWIKEFSKQIETVETFFNDQFHERVSKFMDM